MDHHPNHASTDDYAPTLAAYIRDRSEASLYHAALMSQDFIESGLGPEDIVALHVESLDRALAGMTYRERVRASADAHQFLLEIMIAYGVKYKEYVELKLERTLRDAEARAARERERALEMERLQREKSELLAVIAHELRSPITVAKGSLDLAARSLTMGKVDSLPRLIGSAREALERLSRLSGDLVEASRGGIPTLERTPQDLASIVAQACRWVQAAAVTKGLDLSQELGDGTIVVQGNADALLSVFGNLLSNATRYTPAGGKVMVRCRRVEGDACVEVSDTGIGMTPEVRERVFEKFYRAPDARRVEAQGLGLGLSLVQQLVKAHDGRVEVDSVPEQGTTFRVILPCVRGESEQRQRISRG